MDALISELCELPIIDNLNAGILLFESFKKLKNEKETLEGFFPLGQTLLADFEEIVRNLKSIDLIFKELSQWEETGSSFADFLDEEQKLLLERFWDHFNEQQLTETKKRFILLWRSLPLVFDDFKKSLLAQNQVTSGMAYAMASNFDAGHPFIQKFRKFYFAGFGQLSGSEIQLMSNLNGLGKLSLIWDLQGWYFQNTDHEVTRLFSRIGKTEPFKSSISEAIANSPQGMPKTSFEIISCLGLAGMAQQIKESIEVVSPETAIIVTDPGLIQAITDNVLEDEFPINITMGFPLIYSQQARWIQKVFHWLERTLSESLESIQNMIEDPFFQTVGPEIFTEWNEKKGNLHFRSTTSELKTVLILSPDWLWETNLKSWLKKFNSWWSLKGAELEDKPFEMAVWSGISATFEKVEEMLQNIDSESITPKVIQQFYGQLIRSFPISILGSQNVGVQSMGLFESRLLDFKHVVIGPVEEGSLPTSQSDPSFLTQNIRRIFGLPLQSQKVEDEIYQFYRLCHRAEKITLLVNQSANSKPSRIVHQIHFSPGLVSKYWTQVFGQSLPMPKEIFRDKNDFVLNAISKYQKIESENKVAYLSPSSIHDLLQCDLRFYFKKIEKIKEPDVILKTEMSPFDFGKWVHGTIQNLYEEVGKNGRFLQKSDFETMKSKWEVTQFLVWNALEEKASDGSLNSYYYEKEIGKVMAFRFFDFMSLHPAHRWIRNEMDMEKTYLTFGEHSWLIGGRVDIVLESENQFWIVDLKTGAFDKPQSYLMKADKLDKLEPRVLANKDLFQMLVYDWLSVHSPSFSRKKTRSVLFYMADPNASFIDPLGSISDSEEAKTILNELELVIGRKLKEFSDPTTKITQTDERKYCSYCGFKSICKR